MALNTEGIISHFRWNVAEVGYFETQIVTHPCSYWLEVVGPHYRDRGTTETRLESVSRF